MRTRIISQFAVLVTFALTSNISIGIAQTPSIPLSPATKMESRTRAIQQDELIVEPISQTGGAVRAVAVEGNYAYFGIGPDLVILDISDPSQSTISGRTGPVNGGAVMGIAVSQDYAYIAAGYGGLRVIRATSQTRPTAIGSYDTPGYANDVAVMGNYAYVADEDSGLRIVNISNPAAPVEAGFFDMSGSAYGVAVSGSYAYVAAMDGGLRIIDISNPAAPSEVGFYDTPGVAMGVAIAGSYAYVAAGDSGLRIINVASPTAPVEVGFFDTPYWADSVVVMNGYAYVADQDCLRIINVSDPINPTEVGFYATSGGVDVAVADNYVYVAAQFGGLRIIDTANPAVPVEVGSYYTYTYEARNLVVSGNYVYVAGLARGLRIINIANPVAPVEVGFYDTPGWATGVAIVGSYAYVADFFEGLRIINVANPAVPVEVSFLDTPGHARRVVVIENYAYIVDSETFRIISVANPNAPVEVGFLDVPGIRNVAIAGSYAYVAAWDNGLRIINIANPAAPVEVGFYDTPGYAVNVGVAGNYAYVADRDSGLRIINIVNPVAPVEVGFYDTPGLARGIAIAGDYAYVGDTETLRIINVANPTNPILSGVFGTFYFATEVAISGSYTLVGDWEGGLVILRVLRDRGSASIPPSGGSLTSTDGMSSFVFPSDSFTDTVTVTYNHLLTDQNTGTLVGIGRTFEVTAVYSDTGQPAQPAPGATYTVTIRYSDAEIGPIIEDTLALYWWDGSQWVREPSSVVDVDTNTVTASPGHFSLWAVLGETRQDSTPPVIIPVITGTQGENGWYTSSVTVNWDVSDPESGIASTSGCDTTVLDFETTGETLTCTAVNGAGLTNSVTITIQIDKTPPSIVWAGDISDGDAFHFGFVPSAPTCTASDDVSGLDGSCTVSGYATAVGIHTLTASAKDNAGNQTAETRTYSVLRWRLTGFYHPVDMNGNYNMVKGGSTVPLKFEIFAGSTELTDPAYVKSLSYAETSCNVTAIADEIELTATGGTSLRYDTSSGQFIYNWKTPKAPGKCFRVILTTHDGSVLLAYFKLK